MAARKQPMESFTFSGEDVGAAGAAALRKMKFLANSAPAGRLFASIATLSATSDSAADEFEAAGLAELKSQTEAAESHLHRGMRLSSRLKEAFGAEIATPLPQFLRRN